MPTRLARWSIRVLTCSFLLSTVLLAAPLLPGASGPAQAEPPVRLGTYVVDAANALDGAQLDRVRAAVDNLYANHQVRVWIVYVRDFSGLEPQAWAEQTAKKSGFGGRDLLLTVATQEGSYWFDGELPSTVSDSALDGLLTREVEPALRAHRWADAGAALADGLDAEMRGPTVPWRGLLLAAGVVVLVLLAIFLYSRKRSRDRARAELAMARTVSPDDSTALAALPLEALHTRSRELLVEIDNAIRTSTEELELATGEFGATATTPFSTAVNNAKSAAQQAFSLRQRLDDAIPETPQEQRTMLIELISTVGRADRELDARVAEFDEMRNLLINAPTRLDALTRDLVELTGRLPGAQTELTRLLAAHPASVLAPIKDNIAMARERITFAEQNIDSGRAALTEPVGAQGGAVAAIRAAEAAIGQARTLLDAVDTAAASIQQARDGLPAVLDELRGDIAAATALSGYGGADLTAALGAAQTVLAQAGAAAETNPLGAFHDAVAADGALDRAIGAATDRKLAAEDLLRRVDQALVDARAQVSAAADYLTTRRGGIDAEARTRLSEAQRTLTAAEGLRGERPDAALDNARAAADLAGRALQAAQASVRAWEASRRQDTMNTGAVLGGILIDGFLRGMGSGGSRPRSGGGYHPGSYGGSAGSRRISRGGRF